VTRDSSTAIADEVSVDVAVQTIRFATECALNRTLASLSGGDVVPDLSEYELLKTPLSGPPARQRSRVVAVAAVLLIVAAAVAAYVVFSRRPASGPPAETAQPAQPAPPTPLGGQGAAIDLPPLDQTDEIVRQLVKRITSNPRIAAWLATDNLVRNFTIGVTNVAEGKSPARQLPVWRPSSRFLIIQRGGETIIDPRSDERYNTLAAAAASMDPAGSADLYATLKPRIEEASRELGNGSFDRTLEQAIVLLLSTPEVKDPIRVEPTKGIGYGFADPRLESLAPAQKQLLRSGPANAQSFKTSLRAIAAALGIPESRLPRPQAGVTR
jgi:Protein of unknown function (DUF3014)